MLVIPNDSDQFPTSWEFQLTGLVIPISGNSEVVPLGITNIAITNI